MSEMVHEDAYPAAETAGGYLGAPLPVTVVNQASCGCGKRKRRSMVTRTFTLAAGDTGVGGSTKAQQLLPPSTGRVEAWITSITSVATGSPAPIPSIFVGKSESDVNQQSGATAILYGTNLAAGVQTGSADVPFPLNTTDPVWASALGAALPVTVSVIAFYEQEEN